VAKIIYYLVLIIKWFFCWSGTTVYYDISLFFLTFFLMKDADIDQIKSLINNFNSTHQHIPYFSELEQHSIFGPVFKKLDDGEKNQVKIFIKTYIKWKIESLKTKWGQLFRRFYEMDEQRFWDFRDMNEFEQQSQTREFQIIWKEIEDEMFKLEGILTQAMLNKAEWLGKTIDAFYNIVYMFFPQYSQIE